MKMSMELLTLAEQNIEYGYKKQDRSILEREAISLMNNYAMNLSEVYTNTIHFVKPIKVSLKTDPEFLFKENYVNNLKKLLIYSEQIIQHQLDFLDAKLYFESWFYETTKKGILEYIYNELELVNITDAAEYLGVSRPTLYKYIDRGLETVGEKNNQKVPRFMLEAWRNPEIAFKIQWNCQIKKTRVQSVEGRLADVNKRIEEFEKKYGKPFYLLFGKLSNQEMDDHHESVDIRDWLELEKEKQELLERLRSE